MPNRTQQWLFPLLAFALGAVALCAFLEVALRFLPVADATHRITVDDQNPILRFEPNRDLTYSRDWNLRRVVEHRVNNDGFLNPVDYDPDATSPLVAVVGDSYVEAVMVPFERTIGGRLAAALGDSGRVYTFGLSGAALSQYLAYARHARDRYRPDRLVVVVISNDYDESLIDHPQARATPGNHVYDEDEAGELLLVRVDRRASRLKDLSRRSALIRYLVMNLGVSAAPSRIRNRLQTRAGGDVWVGNVRAEADAERVRNSKRVVDEFLAAIPGYAGLDRGEILFVVDGLRTQLYEPERLAAVGRSFSAQLNAYFIAEARAAGFEVADLQPRFVAHYLIHGQRFEFEDDAHWNALGHGMSAQAVLESKSFASFLSGNDVTLTGDFAR